MAAREAAADSMQDTESTARDICHQAALRRNGVSADRLILPMGSYCFAEERRAQAPVIPDSLCTCATESTIRDWMAAYVRSGFRALPAKPRGDRGRRHGLDSQAAKSLPTLKERYPRRLVRLIIQRAPASDRVPEDSIANRRRCAFRDEGEPWMLSVSAHHNLLYFRELGAEQVPVAVC